MDFEKIRDKCANTLEKVIAACTTPFYKGGKTFEFVKAKKLYVLVGTAGVTIALVGVITLGNISMGLSNPLALEKNMDTVQVTAPVTNENENASVTNENENKTELVTSEVIKYTKDVDVIMDMSIYGYELRVYNKEAGFFTGKIEALDTLNDLRSSYVEKLTDSNLLDSYFKELTSIEPTYKSITEWDGLKTKEEALNYIVKGTKKEIFHEIATGENFWTIASLHNVTVDSLVSANPGIKPERIQIGQKISLTVPKALITVVTVEEAEYVENIEFAVEYEDDSSLYKGESRIATSGKSGEKKVVVKIVKSNGLEKSRVVLSENVTTEPITKLVAKGTKNKPPTVGSGTFARPASRGIVTSGFGLRWGRRHSGIDIGMAIGTTIKASDGGVVTFAGNKGGYGKVVMIDHGANKVSLYAHNSVLIVKRGDRVFKGQNIAKSGNSGISTGPHLHFEIRVNGTPINPTKYVNF